MIGLHLGKCILDITIGDVLEKDVERILTNLDETNIDEAIRMHLADTWSGYPHAEIKARYLISCGKVEFVRQTRKKTIDINQPHWVDDESKVKYY